VNICFASLDPFWGGLGPNGGSRTILKSAEALRALGHRVDVVAVKDNFTWFKHPKILSKIPKDADAVVSISISDIRWMHKQAPVNAKKFYWMRGYENWRGLSNEEYVGKLVKQKIIVNSTGLKLHLARLGIPSRLCWAGMDDETEQRGGYVYKNCTIGFLGPSMHKSKRYDLCQKLKERFPHFHYSVLQNVKESERNDFFDRVGIWFAPTESEGFHNPPAEAALRGAVVICNRLESNGMMDYADDETAMRYDSFDEVVEFVKNPAWDKVKKMQDLLWNKIGTRKQNMEKFVRILEEKEPWLMEK
jgi:hypothetical protein